MKLVIVIASEDYKKEIHRMFLKMHVPIFSEVAIKGFRTWNIEKQLKKTPKYRESHPVFSTMCFTFVSGTQAKSIIEAIEKFNKLQKLAKPIHAYELSVDNSTNVAPI